jgi:hypothetical protein
MGGLDADLAIPTRLARITTTLPADEHTIALGRVFLTFAGVITPLFA